MFLSTQEKKKMIRLAKEYTFTELGLRKIPHLPTEERPNDKHLSKSMLPN